MSGIVGIINLNGAPVDRRLLQRMTDSMTRRGPDAQETYVNGYVGFGHATLRTTFEAEHERQPCSLDGEVWITADARVDGRTELKEGLASHGCRELDNATDSELILHAYHVWGTDCLRHLIGDFAFAIWDWRERRLFCARDQLGVVPLYYALKRESLLFSNSLPCLRTHPYISDTLNDHAVGDFLLFDYNMDFSTTTFADIQRLPPAHSLTCSNGKLNVRRYWNLSIEKEIRYRHERDYVDHFSELMTKAVGDRLRTNRASVLMSGGLDSSSVAAVARGTAPKVDLRAFTFVYDRLMPDQERHYSGIVAQALGIPIRYTVADSYDLHERAEHPYSHTPEPMNEPFLAIAVDQMQQAAGHSRVALTGDGGDPVLHQDQAYLAQMLRSFRVGELAKSTAYFYLHRGSLPRFGFRTMFRRALGMWRPYFPEYPVWLNQSFEAQRGLRDRWKEKIREFDPIHSQYSESCEFAIDPVWQQFFGYYDPDVTATPVDVRHPFFDVRMLRYLRSVPSIPWRYDKLILRMAMRDKLPEAIRMRPKTTIVRDPILVRLDRLNARWPAAASNEDAILEYVDWGTLSQALYSPTQDRIWMDVRPLSLSCWLMHVAVPHAAREKRESYEEHR